MLDSVLNMSKKQIEDAIRILNPCMNDYLYVFDLKEDYYVISKHATERFILPSDKFYNATKNMRILYIQKIFLCLVRK